MAVKTMADYLSVATADYDYTLSLTPQQVMPERGAKKQVIHEYDDGSVSVVTLSDTSRFTIEIEWAILSLSDAGIIMDLWHDSAKANGYARTFYFDHPIDDDTYVVRFMSDLSREDGANMPQHKKIPSLQLRVEAKKATV